jgi:hypothetical protein
MTMASLANVATLVDDHEVLYQENIPGRAYASVALDQTQSSVVNAFIRLACELTRRPNITG